MARKKGTKLTAKQRAKCRSGTLTPAVIEKYLALYSSGLDSGRAAHRAGTTLTTISNMKRKDPVFLERWQQAYDHFTDKLEVKAEAMAMSAWAASPTMLIFLLKARKPNVYRDNVKVEHGGSISFVSDFVNAMERLNSGIAAAQH